MATIEEVIQEAPHYIYIQLFKLVTSDVTKHCKLCDKCFLHLDHHCLFLLKCVASQNHVQFVWLLILSVLNMAAYVLGFLLYIHLQFQHQPWSDILSHLFHQQAWPLSLAILNSWAAVWCTSLLLIQYTQVTRGCTTYFSHNALQPWPLTRVQGLTNFVHFLFNMPLPYKNPYSKIHKTQLTEVVT